MNIWESIILGIIQGLTEFLPVSSSGHIELGKEILKVAVKDPLLFSVVVHAATALSTIVIYRKDIINLLADLLAFKWNDSAKFISYIVISMIPVGIVGVLFEEQIEDFFEGNIILVGAMLLITGFLLWFSANALSSDSKITPLKALIIGIAQAIAILPGISRSGATISTALILGIGRSQAARFSFLMVLPPILGATALKLKKYIDITAENRASQIAGSGEIIESISPMVLGAGFLAAFIFGLIACSWMIKLVKNNNLNYFAVYCFIVGTGAIAYGFLN